jgi:hypothetical protein
MKKASKNDSDHFINDLAKLNKTLKLKTNKLEKLKFLHSELSGGKLYVGYCKRKIEMEERIHEYEKEYPSGPDYPLPPDPKFIENNPVEGQSATEKNCQSESGKSDPVNVFCKSMTINIPKDHFKVFTEKNSKNGKPYLTISEFDAFIEKAFCGNTNILKQKFNQTTGDKLFIQSVFYEFYYKYCFDYFSTMKCQDNFVRLLTDNFEGWVFKNVKDNFKPKNNNMM